MTKQGGRLALLVPGEVCLSQTQSAAVDGTVLRIVLWAQGTKCRWKGFVQASQQSSVYYWLIFLQSFAMLLLWIRKPHQAANASSTCLSVSPLDVRLESGKRKRGLTPHQLPFQPMYTAVFLLNISIPNASSLWRASSKTLVSKEG